MNSSAEPDRSSEPVCDSAFGRWLDAEFHENFTQLRDRDQQILDITKFFATLILGVGTAIVGLLGLKGFHVEPTWIGLLLLATAVVGEMLFLWMITFRAYFVVCARQINAIRSILVRSAPEDIRWVAVQPTDPRYPSVFRWGSSITTVWLLTVVLVVALAAVGWHVFLRGNGIPEFQAAVSTMCLGLAVLLSNANAVIHQGKEKPALVVDIDNTIISDVPRKVALLRQLFNRVVDDAQLAGNYELRGILDDAERLQFGRRFHSPELAELDRPIAGASQALKKLSKAYDIVYLTSRPEFMRAVTVRQLRQHQFPLASPLSSHLVMKERPEEDTTAWKLRKLVPLVARRRVMAGIGDAPTDCIAYARAGVTPICLQSYWSRAEVSAQAGEFGMMVRFVESWSEVASTIADIESTG